MNGPIKKNCGESVVNYRTIVKTANFGSRAESYVTMKRDVKEVISPSAVKEMFEIDFAERETGSGLSYEDRQFPKGAEEGIHHCEDMHYEMPLPFKDKDVKLPNNRAIGEQRLNRLRKSLLNDERTATITLISLTGLSRTVTLERSITMS